MFRPTVLIAVLVAASLAALAGCPKALEEPAAPIAPPTKVKLEKRKVDPAELGGGDEVRPVYPASTNVPHPMAARVCGAIHGAGLRARERCCGSVSAGDRLPLQLCLAALSDALSSGAIRIDEARLGQCQAEHAAWFEGCGWVRPMAADPPPSCRRLLVGMRASGDGCASSLECARGLHCTGAGPTERGVCAAPLGDGAPCATAVDVLASHTLDQQALLEHPTCRGYCALHKCEATSAPGATCRGDAQCGADARCLEGRCVAGAAPDVGQRCDDGLCRSGARCRDGVCRPRQDEGAPCDGFADCRGGCLKEPGASSGRCGMQCR